MITRPHAFRVFGEPAPKGSLAGRCLTHPRVGAVCVKAARVVLSEDANRGRPWRKAIETAAPVHITERPDKHQALRITLMFAISRTAAAHSRTMPSTRSAQGVGGDLDKMVRLVLDALESCGVLLDDAQVCTFGGVDKVFADDIRWHEGVDRWRGVPGLYCRLAPAGYVPPGLPFEDRLDADERGGR